MKWLQIGLAAALAGVAGYIGVVGIPVLVLIIVMALDYASGVAKAFIMRELSSGVGARGIVKKLCYMLLVAVGMCIDYLLHSGLAGAGIGTGTTTTPYCGLAVTAWLIINELLSIVENAGAMGLPVPKALLSHLEKMQE